MSSKTPPSSLRKRPNEESSIERPRKSPFGTVKVEGFSNEIIRFRILLPIGTTLELKMTELRSQIPIEEFIDAVKREYFNTVKRTGSPQPKKRINWNYADLHFKDADGNKIRTEVKFRDLPPNNWHFLALYDGSAEPEVYEDMWDLTPDTELLKELPDEYTFETALADLIDNSLQAVWSNRTGERRLISVELHKNRISIFDTGPGMDGVNEKIVKWGKMGASLHRPYREHAIGGKPPYLMPFFGMFGYGGPVATMFLGWRAVVSSKTKNCNKVFTLHLEREALIRSENQWKTKGGMRDPLGDEMGISHQGSFTKVEILELKTSSLDAKKLRCKLKDIYFPYIQCDEMSGKTSTPIEFQVNGIDLTGIEGGEVAITNMNSCNGPEFTLQLHFSCSNDASSPSGQKQKAFPDANARLRFVYFPIIKGEESITTIINKLEADGFEMRESFETYSRVSVRRLGRLLPDARWTWLPFMEPKTKKGERAQNLKRCRYRVKCFIETDSGFTPTPTKTDLAHHHPYTNALKNFGNGTPVNGKEVQIEIWRDGKKLTLTTLEKQYNDWISEMHDLYDDEIESGLDQPTIVFSGKCKNLGMSSDVLRVHKEIKRKGTYWKAGQRMKILKGACAGFHKNNVFATLEYIILEGLAGDACGEARLICRPLGLPEAKGCCLSVNQGNNVLDIRDSLSLPVSVIDSDKCTVVGDVEWKSQLEKHRQKLPSCIDLLSLEECQELEVGGGFPTDVIEAGEAFPHKIIAIVRPKAFYSASSPKRLDQKFIVRENFEMSLEVNFGVSEKNTKSDHIYSVRIKPSSHKGLQGVYIFLLSSKIDKFRKAGFYSFFFSLAEMKDVRFKKVVQVKALAEVGRWRLVNHNQNSQCTIRVGSRSPPFSVACYDRYNNRLPFTSIPKPTIKLIKGSHVLAQVCHMKVTADKSIMTIKDIVVDCYDLDKIRPKYEATLNISSVDEALSVDCPCQVLPGSPKTITTHPPKLRNQLLPGQIIEKLVLEVFDEYGNHVQKDENILLRVDGFSFQDGSSVVCNVVTDCTKMVDARGYVDISNILKVSKGYGKDVSFSVISKEKVIFKVKFQTERRELRTESKIFKHCEAGSELENIVFEIVDSDGVVDENINDNEKHGQIHTLILKSDTLDMDNFVRYGFSHGRCTIRSIHLPQREGIFTFTAAHSRYPDLKVDIEVHVENDQRENLEIGNHEDWGDSEWSPKASFRNVLTSSQTHSFQEVEPIVVSPQGLKENILYSSSCLKTPELEHHSGQHENSDSRTLQVDVSASQDRGKFTRHPLICIKELEDDLAKCGLTIGKHESDLKMLKLRQSTLQRRISDLQALTEPDTCDVPSAFGKRCIEKKIESRGESASAFVCKLEKLESENRPRGILGVVALLGSVQTMELSRMLAQYLGEDQMLAIVCENYAAAESFDTRFSSKFGVKCGQSSSGRYFTLCLENIRPNSKESKLDAENLDSLQRPTLPNGSTPDGFLGYAVHMINMEAIENDHGIRETLLYCLFGGLQVYENQRYMKKACTCIRDGAISLDGGIMKANGLISFGNGEQVIPDIIFPVENKIPVSPTRLQVLKCLEARKLELEEVNRKLDKKNTLYEIDMEIFHRSRNRYNNYLSEKESTLRNNEES